MTPKDGWEQATHIISREWLINVKKPLTLASHSFPASSSKKPRLGIRAIMHAGASDIVRVFLHVVVVGNRSAHGKTFSKDAVSKKESHGDGEDEYKSAQAEYMRHIRMNGVS